MSTAYSHRGIRTGLEENTLAAFQRAWDAGIPHLETDVRTSADGTVYAFHDDTVDRITGGTGPVAEHRDAQLDALRAGGQPLCTFAQLLAAFPGATFNVDVKDERSIAPLAKVIEEQHAHQRVALAAFDSARSAAVAHLLSAPIRRSPGRREIILIWLCAHLFGRVPRRLARDWWAVQVPFKQGILPVATGRFIRAVQAAGAQVHVWVVNDEPTMRLLAARGADGIMSDDGQLLVQVLRSLGA